MNSKVAAWFRTVTVIMLFLMGVVLLSVETTLPTPLTNIPTLEEKALVKVKLSISPEKSVYIMGEEVTYSFEVSLNKDNPTYQKGFEYLLYLNHQTSPANCSIISSTIDSLTYLTDEQSSVSGTVKLECNYKNGTQGICLFLSAYRISQNGQGWRMQCHNIVYDRGLLIKLTDRIAHSRSYEMGLTPIYPDVVEYVGKGEDRSKLPTGESVPSFPELKVKGTPEGNKFYSPDGKNDEPLLF